jgi:hypothetical protein
MRKSASIAARIRPLIVVFLFFSFIVASFNLGKVVGGVTGQSFSKASHGYAKANTDISFEEKESEIEKNEERGESQIFLINLIREVSLLPLFELRTFHSLVDAGNEPMGSALPVYLAKRSLLI